MRKLAVDHRKALRRGLWEQPAGICLSCCPLPQRTGRHWCVTFKIRRFENTDFQLVATFGAFAPEAAAAASEAAPQAGPWHATAAWRTMEVEPPARQAFGQQPQEA